MRLSAKQRVVANVPAADHDPTPMAVPLLHEWKCPHCGCQLPPVAFPARNHEPLINRREPATAWPAPGVDPREAETRRISVRGGDDG